MAEQAPERLATKSLAPRALGRVALASFDQARGERLLLQDLWPFPQSLEWELGQAYLREQGSKAFLHDAGPVPYVINNDGSLSLAAAQLLFTALAETEQGQTKGTQLESD